MVEEAPVRLNHPGTYSRLGRLQGFPLTMSWRGRAAWRPTRSWMAMVALLQADESKLMGLGRSGASVRQVVAALRQRPLIGIPQLAARAVEQLVALGIAREITGGRRNRVFVYDGYLAILGEGAEPLCVEDVVCQ